MFREPLSPCKRPLSVCQIWPCESPPIHQDGAASSDQQISEVGLFVCPLLSPHPWAPHLFTVRPVQIICFNWPWCATCGRFPVHIPELTNPFFPTRSESVYKPPIARPIALKSQDDIGKKTTHRQEQWHLFTLRTHRFRSSRCVARFVVKKWGSG